MSDEWPKPKLVVVEGDQHDLPPMWDGEPVLWSGWQPLPITSARFHGSQWVCECGNVDQNRWVSCYGGERMSNGRPQHRFWVTRCMDCHRDEVWDEVTEQSWALDATDYSDRGSVEPAAVSS